MKLLSFQGSEPLKVSSSLTLPMLWEVNGFLQCQSSWVMSMMAVARLRASSGLSGLSGGSSKNAGRSGMYGAIREGGAGGDAGGSGRACSRACSGACSCWTGSMGAGDGFWGGGIGFATFWRHGKGVRFRYECEFVILSKLGRSELQSWYRGHVIKTQLQLVCCTLVQEPGCLVISEGWSERVSRMRCRMDGELRIQIERVTEIRLGILVDYKLKFNYLSVLAYIQNRNGDEQWVLSK